MNTALLLGDPSPSLRWRAAVELDGAPLDDPEVVAWRAEVARSDEVRGALADLAQPAGGQIQGGFALTRLAHLGYRGPEVDDAVEALFARQQPDGSWPHHPQAEDGPAPKRSRKVEPSNMGAEPYSVVTMETVVPLRGIAASGHATDLRAERAYEWLLGQRIYDGSWVGTHREGYGLDFRAPGARSETPAYRVLANGQGCRSATTAAVAALVLHPTLRDSEAARVGAGHLLLREDEDVANVGWELARLTGHEPPRGRLRFHVVPDPAHVLHLASSAGLTVDDPAVRRLAAFLESRRGPHGLWSHHAHPQLARWLTFDLEASLRRAGASSG